MVDQVLPDVPYAQLVFTIPKMLRRAVLFERKLYGELCRVAYAATRKFFEVHFPGLEKAVAAMVAAPQSFGSLLNFHPHVHAVCSLGVFTRDGVFHPVPEDLDFAALEELFRDEVFRVFLKHGAVTEERIELLRSWRHSGFGVDASRRVENDKLSKEVAGYVTALEAVVARHDDAVGYAFAINGKLNTADVYASHALFGKLWPKLLQASAAEAIGQLGGEKAGSRCTAQDIAACLAKTGGEEKSKKAGDVTTVSHESKDGVIFETLLGAQPATLELSDEVRSAAPQRERPRSGHHERISRPDLPSCDHVIPGNEVATRNGPSSRLTIREHPDTEQGERDACAPASRSSGRIFRSSSRSIE